MENIFFRIIHYEFNFEFTYLVIFIFFDALFAYYISVNKVNREIPTFKTNEIKIDLCKWTWMKRKKGLQNLECLKILKFQRSYTETCSRCMYYYLCLDTCILYSNVMSNLTILKKKSFDVASWY